MKIALEPSDNAADNPDTLRFLRDAEAIVRVAHIAHEKALDGNRLLRRFADALRAEHDAMAVRVAQNPNSPPEVRR